MDEIGINKCCSSLSLSNIRGQDNAVCAIICPVADGIVESFGRSGVSAREAIAAKKPAWESKGC